MVITDKITKDDLFTFLSIEDKKEFDLLTEKSYKSKLTYVGKKVYYRGIIEFSNICIKDCYYCGIRKSNSNVDRFSMDSGEIIKSALWAHENQYGSIVIQSGERNDNKFTSFITHIISEIKDRTDNKLGITLSLGEQNRDTLEKWYGEGAHRYLLRIESSDKNLYKTLHPDDHDFSRRLDCLELLKDIGYQVGTGVMIGLPGQTTEDLVNDILFFEKHDIDMIGMGPFIPHKDTPLSHLSENFDPEKQLFLALKMIAASRLYLKDVNIAATTALQALNPKGRELGLTAGANIIMPNITDTKYRSSYQLYDNKPCLDENSGMCKGCLENRIGSIGEEIGLDQWGDSPHFFKRKIYS